jgi:hypothetical protein
MSENSSILSEGARRVRRSQRIMWWIFAVNLILAFASAAPLSHRIGDVTDRSLASQRLVNGFDWGTYSELLTTPDVNFGSVFPESAWAILVFFVFMLFLTGGVLASYVNDYRLSTRDFFANCGAFFWRWVRLLIFMLVPVIAIAWAGDALLHWSGTLINDAAAEKTGYFVYLFFVLLTVFLLMVVRLWFDMAQVHAVVEDERAMRRSCARAFKLTLANFGSLFWMYFRISFLGWLAFALGLWLWIRLSGPAAVIMFEFVLLWLIATRLWQRASEVAWYQQRVLVPDARTFQIASPASAPTSTNTLQDPINPTE